MNVVLVFMTFGVLLATAIGVGLLASERVFPGKNVLGFIPNDGIDSEREGKFPLIMSAHPDSQELTRITFDTAWRGYKRDEVDETLRLLTEENARLHELLGRKGTNA